MEFQVNTNNVILSKINQVESGEYNVTECRFIFSSEYEGLTKIAVFTGANEDAYKITILNNKCEIPSELLTESQIVQIGVYAYEVQGTEFILRYSPMPTRFMIEKGSYVVNAVNMSRPTPTEVEQLQSQITHNANDIEDLQQTVSEHTTAIENLQNDVGDIQTEQTEQNTKIQKNTDDIVNINQAIDTINTNITDIDSAIGDINEDIDNLEQDLTNYSLITETGSQINLNINSTNYKITAILKDKNGNVIYTSNAIDLPIESMIVNARYDNTTKEIVLTLQNGNTLRISVADLVSGLVSETQLQTILANYYTKIEVDNLLSALAGRVSTNEEDISDIKAEQITQNTNIEELQNQVENLQTTLDNANAEIEELNTDITNMRKASYKVNGEGADITLENTSENKFVEFGLEGRTEQEQLSGKNLFDINNISNTNVITIVNDTITLANNTNPVGYTPTNKRLKDVCPLLAVGDNVYISFKTTSNSTSKNTIYLNGANIAWSSGTAKTITQEMLDSYFTLYGGYDETAVISEFMVRKSTEDDTYEPYCGGIPAPNPDYSQQIKNVTGNANVKIQNKNWFDKDNATTVVGYFSGDGRINYGGSSTIITSYSEIKPNIDFTISGCPIEAICFYDKDKNFIQRKLTSGTINENAYYIRLQAPTRTFDINKLQLELGSTATSYVPHQEQNYPLTLGDIELCEIDTAQDYFYKENGKWYKHKEINKVIFNGSEQWERQQPGHTNVINLYVNLASYGSTVENSKVFCNIAKYGSAGANNDSLINICQPNGIGSNFLIDLSLEEFPSIESFKSYLQKNNMELIYKLKTPVNIEITDTALIEQLEAILRARSYDDITYITSTSDELGFNMNVVAVADANKVIENQNNEIDTIKSRLDLLEG